MFFSNVLTFLCVSCQVNCSDASAAINGLTRLVLKCHEMYVFMNKEFDIEMLTVVVFFII